MEKWTVLSREYVIDNPPYLRTRRDRCRLPGGQVIEIHVHEYTHWVNAVVLTPEFQVVLVEQYRHGTGCFSLETPGGMVDANERPIDAIIREVAEETGYRSPRAPVVLGEFFPNPANSDNLVTTFLIPDAKLAVAPHRDATEDMVVKLLAFETWGAMIGSGEAPHMFSAMGYFLAKDRNFGAHNPRGARGEGLDLSAGP